MIPCQRTRQGEKKLEVKLKRFGKTRILKRVVREGLANWFIDDKWLGGEANGA